MGITEERLSLDDVLLVPQRLTFSSRFNGDIDLSMQLLPGLPYMKYPIVSANMDTVTESRMANKMKELGGLGIVHRFMDIKDHEKEIFRIEREPRILCIGVGGHSKERFDAIIKGRDKTYIQGVLIDVAHGHSNAVIDRIIEVKEARPDLPVIAGNVATYQGTRDLLQAGADCVKVGVGPGSLCTTRIKTGCGVPQLTAIMDALTAVNDWFSIELEGKSPEGVWKPTLIADGGIKNSGDIVKALAAGASAVMIGALFAGTDETPGRVVNFPGKGRMKEYRGMASREAQESWKGRASSIEGEMTFKPYKGSMENVFNELISGVLSGMSYQNARNIRELQKHADFRKITSAGWKESLPHGTF